MFLQHIPDNIPACLDPHPTLQPSTYLEIRNSYIRMKFVDFSAFNTTSPVKLIGKLNTLGLSTTLCYWILNLLTSTPENVHIGALLSQCSTPDPPRAVCLSPSCSRCTPMTAHQDKSIFKYVDAITIIWNIINNDESSHREEINSLAAWCTEKNLLFNVSKTMKITDDFWSKEAKTHNNVYISGAGVKQVNRDLEVPSYVSHHLVSPQLKKKNTQQKLFFLQNCRKAKLWSQILVNIYWTIENIFTGNITTWHIRPRTGGLFSGWLKLPQLQKYRLSYHQTTEQLHSPGYETPELTINTPLSKIDVGGLKNSTILFFYNSFTYLPCIL